MVFDLVTTAFILVFKKQSDQRTELPNPTRTGLKQHDGEESPFMHVLFYEIEMHYDISARSQ